MPVMIWSILFISLGLASARSVSDVESEFLNELEEELARFEEDAPQARDAESQFLNDLEEELARFEEDVPQARDHEERSARGYLNRVSELGDILLTDEQARQGINFNKYSSYKWPNGRVPYNIKSDHFTSREKQTIESAISDLNQRLSAANKVKLVPRTTEPDYITVISGQGCYSYLGRTGGEQTLSLQRNGCLYPQTIQHEFMHAIGFTHEQNREDRDNYVDVLWNNIPENWRSQYQKVDPNDFPNIGNYEWYSIMHYPWWAPDSNGKDAFYIKGANVDKNKLGEGKNNGATDMDIYKINTLYS